MAKTVKKKTKTRAKKRTRKTTRVVRERQSEKVSAELCTTELQMNGSRLVVRLSRDDHPEIFDLEHLAKHMRDVAATYQGKRKMRDVLEFIAETEKSLQILLKNHLEDAMRMYFK